MIITSRENKIFKLAVSLKDKHSRDQHGLFLIEGSRSVYDALKNGAEFHSILLSDGSEPSKEFSCSVYTLAPKLFKEISQTVTPQGIMAICKIPRSSLSDIKQSENSCVIMCENVQDPGNIGTIIRTAHAAFCDGVILTKGCCDLYNPKIIRATMSGVFSVPSVCNASSIQTIEFFRSCGYKISAGALTENAVMLYDADFSGKQLIIIGNEGNGVSDKTLSLCDNIVKIPMKETAESLNVSVAGAVLVYEHYRQNI